MKSAVLISFVLCVAVTVAIPPPGGFAGPFMPSPDMIKAFIPTPEQIAAFNAMHSTPAPKSPAGPGAAAAAGPSAPPTMPPAVASMLNNIMAAKAVFTPPAAPAM